MKDGPSPRAIHSLVDALEADGAPVPTRDQVLDKIAIHHTLLEYYQALLEELDGASDCSPEAD